MTLFNELEVVRATQDISTDIHKGSRGTIIMVFDTPTEGYLVEFVGADSEYLGLATVSPGSIEKCDATPNGRLPRSGS